MHTLKKLIKEEGKKSQHIQTHMPNAALRDTTQALFSIKGSTVHVTEFVALQISPVHYVH